MHLYTRVNVLACLNQWFLTWGREAYLQEVSNQLWLSE